ncbi:hypothetical protein ACIBF7_22130 [Nonomuraea sp. NPDC050478]|uniref:hypothetical protein n=1 Tax=Nonomuraea sp. NPDC050478 TaxID=3364365 RepID=UPI003790BAC6
MKELDAFEDDLVARFERHPVLAGAALLSADGFAAVLLQRRFLSLAFTPAYDLAIDLLEDESSRRIARVILREEYPGGDGRVPSHREDMKADMLRLGVSRKALVETAPTAVTVEATTAIFRLIAEAGRGPDADLRLVTILRFWGEILVAAEYGRLWPRMAQALTGDGVNRSRFYHPHLVHDAKAHPLGAESLPSATHSDQLGARLAELVTGEESAAGFRETEQRVLRIKTDFYDQFLPLVPAPN